MPGFSVYPQPVAASKLVGKLNAVGQTLLAASLTTPSNTTSPSGWVQIAASSSAEWYLTGVGIWAPSGNLNQGTLPLITDIGIGSAGAESVVASCVMSQAAYTGSGLAPSGWYPLMPSVRIASGTRISVRIATTAGQGTTATCLLRIGYVPVANVEGN